MLAVAFGRDEVTTARIPRHAQAPLQLRGSPYHAPCSRQHLVAVRPKDDRGMFAFQMTGQTRIIALAAMTDVVDVQIEMIAPEERRNRERLARSENIARGSLTLTSLHPVFHANSAGTRIGPARDVARGKNAGNVGFQELVYHTPLSVAMPAFSARFVFGRTPIPITTSSHSNFVPSSSCTCLS